MKANSNLSVIGIALPMIGIPLALCVNYLLGLGFIILGIIFFIIYGIGLIKEKSYEDNQKTSIFLYKISLIIPLLGIIAGAILLTSEDKSKKRDGKVCIIFSLVPIFVCVALTFLIFAFFVEL